MKIVLDTNVLVAGLLSPFGPCGDIVRMVTSGNLTLCVDARVLSEYDEVLNRPKFQFDPDRVASILDYIKHSGWVVSSVPLSASLPDPDDEPFLEIAISANADYLVTGNAAHFPPELRQGVKVVSPSAFLKRAVRSYVP
ncbi:putative toxin-antitoxin system toxin component, PIN family [Desulfoferrobacter suflitae]|uniref:putative toxin-antitoxin system toxin component, PIN family n=1 Tax=Desulfoferrobacter suflitae TaxID=2865782 RepID=UPI0021648F91|nr:putative toxin-antitoxin system toxin component, PIN family [Desulfoferrobacter suflitae]MCK8602610.1 putative toxin-antitoxin system toxin component, PIN family [Desulfoferrobacter suflitae]